MRGVIIAVRWVRIHQSIGGKLKMTDSIWNSFIDGYCKVEFLCYQGAPNWLGWIVLGVVGYILAGIIIITLTHVVESEAIERKRIREEEKRNPPPPVSRSTDAVLIVLVIALVAVIVAFITQVWMASIAR